MKRWYLWLIVSLMMIGCGGTDGDLNNIDLEAAVSVSPPFGFSETIQVMDSSDEDGGEVEGLARMAEQQGIYLPLHIATVTFKDKERHLGTTQLYVYKHPDGAQSMYTSDHYTERDDLGEMVRMLYVSSNGSTYYTYDLLHCVAFTQVQFTFDGDPPAQAQLELNAYVMRLDKQIRPLFCAP